MLIPPPKSKINNFFYKQKSVVLSRYERFIATGLLNTVTGYAIYASLVLMNAPHQVALLTGTVLGVVINYVSYRSMVFDASHSSVRLVKFIITYFGVYIINSVSLELLTTVGELDAYSAQLVCLLPCVALSWVFLNYWVFKKVNL
jgi:putative flippase GtrA